MVGALVAHTAGGRLTLVDSDLQVHEIRGALGAPRDTAVSPDARLAYVSDSERQEIVVVEVSGRRVVGRVPVGGPCRHLGIDRTGTRLWTALGSTAERVAVLARRPTVRDSLERSGCCFSPTAHRLHARRPPGVGDLGLPAMHRHLRGS